MSYWPEEWGPKPDWSPDDPRWHDWRPPWVAQLHAAGLRRRLEHMLQFCTHTLRAIPSNTEGIRDVAAMMAIEGRDMKLHGLQVRNAATVAIATKEMRDEQGVRSESEDDQPVQRADRGGQRS